MSLHQTSGRSGLGLALASTTMLAWATLPIALSAMLRDLNPATLISFRFLVASLVLAAILASRGSLPRLSRLGPSSWPLLVCATLCMAANCLLFLLGLDMTTPANTQVVMQACPLLLYCALNTLVAYGTFSAGLENVEASRVGAVIALAPIVTFGFIELTDQIFRGVLPAEQFSPWMLLGAATVVIGSVITARG